MTHGKDKDKEQILLDFKIKAHFCLLQPWLKLVYRYQNLALLS